MKRNHHSAAVQMLALVLALAICVGFLPVTAHAAPTTPVNQMRRAENLNDVEELDGPASTFWQQYTLERRWVKKIVFHDSMDNLPDRAILDYSANYDRSVVGWYFPNELHLAANGKIRLPQNSSWLFAYFSSLETIEWNNAVETTDVTNMEAMFFGCHNLKDLDVSFFDTSKVTNMNRMFGFCDKVEKLDVSNFDTSKVTDFGCTFSSCHNLKELDVSKFDTSSAVYMYSMFFRCRQLEKLDVSHFNTSNVRSVTNMFNGCDKVAELDISGFDFSKVQNSYGFMSWDAKVNGEPWTKLFW